MNNTRSAKQFWAVAEQFRAIGPPWMPTNAGYEARRVLEADGRHWTVCLKVHVVPADGAPGKGGTRLRFKASVTFWPPNLNNREQRRLAKLGWYGANQQVLATAGYRGKWSKSPYGIWGDFWKDLRGPADVRREARRLETLRLGVLAIQASR